MPVTKCAIGWPGSAATGVGFCSRLAVPAAFLTPNFTFMETNSNADEPMPEEPAEGTPQHSLFLDEPSPEPIETAISPYRETATGSDGEESLATTGTESESQAEQAVPSTAGDSLSEIATRAQSGRLSPAEEERGASLIKEALLAGKTAVTDVVEILPQLPWIVGVSGVGGVWSEMKAAAKTLLIKSLTENQSDAARRLRLSLARGLFKQDVPIALKIAAGVAKEMWDKESGAVSPRSAQIFSNVLIGKAKPWVAQLPLAELKPAEADALVHCALLTVFTLPHPPVAQLGIMKWAAEAGRLAKVQEPALGAVLNGLSRWSAKWQAALRRETKELPEVFAGRLRPTEAERAPETAPETAGSPAAEQSPADFDEQGRDVRNDPPDSDAAPESVKKVRPIYEPRPQRSAPPPEAPRESRRERPVYQARNAPDGASNFNLSETLRQIEAHVASLRAEVSAGQAKLRQKEDDPRKSRRSQERTGIIIEGDRSAEELARLNVQLEGRISELQQRIQDLLGDGEDRAASLGAQSGTSAPDSDSQLRALLALKLQENFADFCALEKASPAAVVQQHYKSLLQNVFDVLRHEGVLLKEGEGLL